MSPTTDANGVKQYKIADHLGSTRLAVSGAGTDGQYNYAPYGKREVVSATSATRKGFIDREQDLETGLGNFGVMGYDGDEGVFGSVDILWEESRPWGPYNYGHSNPLCLTDGTGKTVDLGYFMKEVPERSDVYSLMGELERITGLSLYIKEGFLEIAENGKVSGGSSTAREMLIKMIKDKRNIVIYRRNHWENTGSFLGDNINIRSTDMERAERKASGIDPMTLGWGMTLLHEYLHTTAGGNYKNPAPFPGPVDWRNLLAFRTRSGI